jgi:hypothetical protein
MKSIFKKSLSIALTCLFTILCYGDEPVVNGSLEIQTNPEGAKVIIDGKYKGNTPLTFMGGATAQKYVVEIQCDGYKPIYQTVVLKPGATEALSYALTPSTCLALITSDPAGATVTRDGIDIGVTPLLITDLTYGEYNIELSLNGYKPQNHKLKIDNVTPQKLSVELVSTFATAAINSNPTGANIFINGSAVGTTPCTLNNIPEGDAIIKVSIDGYAEFSETVSLVAGQEHTINAQLEPMPSSLKIITIPEKARIYVDNQYRGESPVELIPFSAGTYRVRAELSGYELVARNVDLKPAENRVEEFRLQPNSGAISVVTTPAFVSIKVDGKEFEKTKPAEESDQLSAETIVNLIPEGEHEFTFSRAGYADFKLTKTITRNSVVQLGTIKLKRLFIPDFEVKTSTTTYRGMYIRDDAEFIYLETKPGITTAIEKTKIISRKIIKTNQ